jgi:hypothetical protein
MIDGMNGEVRIVDRSSKETLGCFGRPGRQVGMFTALRAASNRWRICGIFEARI